MPVYGCSFFLCIGMIFAVRKAAAIHGCMSRGVFCECSEGIVTENLRVAAADLFEKIVD